VSIGVDINVEIGVVPESVPIVADAFGLAAGAQAAKARRLTRISAEDLIECT
jgi:hypothetical protein